METQMGDAPETSRHYQAITILHEQQCTMLGSVTVRSFAQLSGMIMSEIGGDLEGYGLLNVARSEEPINELPQEPSRLPFPTNPDIAKRFRSK